MELPVPVPGPAPKEPGKPRRPHHKSRTGCLQCKQRKVKCDEQKPVCKKCENHNQLCSYLQTHPLKRGPPTVQSMLASPSPTTPSTPSSAFPPTTPSAMSHSSHSLFPANFTILDLELLHWWTTHCVESFVDFDSCVHLFRLSIVELAFVHSFLIHEILSLSALHLSLERPHRASVYQEAADAHFSTALALFNIEIANLNAQNCDACFAFSIMIFTHAWAGQDLKKPSSLFFAPSEVEGQRDGTDAMHVKWVKLHRGSILVLQELFPGIRDGVLEPLFAPWKGRDPHRGSPLPAIEEAQFSSLPAAWSQCFPQKETLDKALMTTRRVFSMLAFEPTISKMSAVMSWFSMISDEFIKMLEEKIPEALLIAAYYCVALKRADHMWWVRGKGENLLRTVLGEMGPGWERWTAWPVEQVFGGTASDRGVLRVDGLLG